MAVYSKRNLTAINNILEDIKKINMITVLKSRFSAYMQIWSGEGLLTK